LSITAAAGISDRLIILNTGICRRIFMSIILDTYYSSDTKYADTRFACCNTAESTIFYTIVNDIQYSKIYFRLVTIKNTLLVLVITYYCDQKMYPHKNDKSDRWPRFYCYICITFKYATIYILFYFLIPNECKRKSSRKLLISLYLQTF